MAPQPAGQGARDGEDHLLAKLEAVTDRASFFEFVRALVANREAAVAAERVSPSSPYGPDAGGWENTKIETYLEACLACAEDNDLSPAASWRLFAQFLIGGVSYE